MSAEGALVEELKRLVLENATLKAQVTDLQTRAVLTDNAQAKVSAPQPPPGEEVARNTRFLVVEETVTYEELMAHNGPREAHGVIAAVVQRLAASLLKSHTVQVVPVDNRAEYRVRIAAYHWPENLPQMKMLFG